MKIILAIFLLLPFCVFAQDTTRCLMVVSDTTHKIDTIYVCCAKVLSGVSPHIDTIQTEMKIETYVDGGVENPEPFNIYGWRVGEEFLYLNKRPIPKEWVVISFAE